MDERKRALLAYIMTIRPYVETSKSADEFVKKIGQCVMEDGRWAYENGLQAGVLALTSFTESLVGSLGRAIQARVGRVRAPGRAAPRHK